MGGMQAQRTRNPVGMASSPPCRRSTAPPPHRAAASCLNRSWSACTDLSASSLVLASISNCLEWPVAAAAVSCNR